MFLFLQQEAEKSLSTIVNDMFESMGKFRDEHDIVCIAHGDAVDDANYLANLVRKPFPINRSLQTM